MSQNLNFFEDFGQEMFWNNTFDISTICLESEKNLRPIYLKDY